MAYSPVARRYARALYEEAGREGRVDQIDDDMAGIHQALADSRDLLRFFESPIISREKKASIIESLFGQRLQALTLTFLRLLIEKQREMLFPEIVEAYRALRDKQLGVVEAHARVAIPLSAEEEKALTQALERKTGARIRLRVVHDPGLIGGVVVRVGDTVYDGSVRHQLASLRERLEHGALSVNGA